MTIFHRHLATVFALFALSTGTAAQSGSGQEVLYKAETVVTGKELPERLRGFAIGAEDVLVKLTGRVRLAKSAQAKAVIAKAPELVAAYEYEDRMKDIPIHDEQGTRDRPHFLRMTFDAEKFDKALEEAGLEKWTGKRPTVAVWLAITEPRGKYILSRDGDEGYVQRLVLNDASKKRAIPVVLPPAAQEDVKIENIVKRNWSVLLNASKALGTDAVLYGTMDFDGVAYWNCQWVVAGDGAYAKWKMKGVSFDTAFKEAIDRVAAAHARHASKNGH
jgi:hypothetical protein